MRTVWAAVDAVNAKFGCHTIPLIGGLEVSIDFTPKCPSVVRRRELVGVLIRHHFPGREILAIKRDRPRCSWGEEQVQFVLPWSDNAAINETHLRSNENDLPAFVDACFYVGERSSPLVWRTMDKTVDRQNRAQGTWVDLPEEQRRVRIEVALGVEELHNLGLEWLDDLEEFNFVPLQRRYFRFMKPTFATPDPAAFHPVIRRYLEKERLTKFFNAGVLGLHAMDKTLARESKRNRKGLAKTLRSRGMRLRPESRAGRGETGTLVAYEELNAKVEMALRHLGEKVRRG